MLIAQFISLNIFFPGSFVYRPIDQYFVFNRSIHHLLGGFSNRIIVYNLGITPEPTIMKWLNHFFCSLCILPSLSLSAQQVTPTVINSAGGGGSSANIFIDWTIGEMPLIETYSGTTLSVTNGFLQAGTGFLPTSLRDLPSLTSSEIKIFPNPVSDEIQVQFQLNSAGKIQIILFDISGKKLIDRQLVHIGGSQLQFINLRKYPQGSYQLFLYYKPANGTQPKTGIFKVQKLK
jgi:hypothetical protein